MKRVIGALLIVLLLCAGCATQDPEGVLVIKEKLFVQQTNDVYFNIEDYLNTTVRYEGMFQTYQNSNTNETEYYVIRYGPGCCGIDAEAGFEVRWQNQVPQPLPEENAWVQVEGVIGSFAYGRQSIPYVQVTSMVVLDKRGAEYVYE